MVKRRRPWAEKRGDTWRARWPIPGRSPGSKSGFTDEAAALQHGWDELGKVGRGEVRTDKYQDRTLREEIADWWVRSQIDDLAPGTVSTYRSRIEYMILPAFGDWTLGELVDADAEIGAWHTSLRRSYSENYLNATRTLLTMILGDAEIVGRLSRNPARRRRGRGRRDGRGRHTKPEKVWATPLQALLLAERASLLTGVIDDFVFAISAAYTGMRFGELIGLERRYFRKTTVRVEWQIQRQPGAWLRIPPKDGSRRVIDVPGFLSDLLDLLCESADGVCHCDTHEGGPYVWRPRSPAEHLHHAAMDEKWLRPAADGLYLPKRPGNPRLPVYADAGGVPLHGHRTDSRAEAAWMPLLPGLTLHGLRHSHRVMMDDDDIPEILKHERLGHELGGMPGVYAHVSDEARRHLMTCLTARWKASLKARAEIDPHSRLPLLDELLKPYREDGGSELCSQSAPKVTRIHGSSRLRIGG